MYVEDADLDKRHPGPETDDKQAPDDQNDAPGKDETDEQAEESFPASDPPAW